MFYWRIFIYASLLLKCCARTGKIVEFHDREDFVQFLKDNPPLKFPPKPRDGQPAVVNCEMVIESLDSINEKDMDISLTFLLRFRYYNQYFVRYAIKDVDKIQIPNELADQLWTPELYFLNEKWVYFHETFLPNKKYTYYMQGNVSFSSRYTLTADCAMEFQDYPFDKQICRIEMESFIHEEQTIVLQWNKNNPVVLKEHSVRTVSNFDLAGIETKKISVQNEEGNFSRVSMELILVRNTGYYLMQMYMPCVLSVAMSWMSFWIDVIAASERLGLGVVTVLTMVTHNADVNSQLTSVSYTKAVDIYTSTCLILVFLALLQYIMVYSYAQKAKACENDDKQASNRYHQTALRIDIVSRIVFPSLFVVFNVIYLGYFLSKFYENE